MLMACTLESRELACFPAQHLSFYASDHTHKHSERERDTQTRGHAPAGFPMSSSGMDLQTSESVSNLNLRNQQVMLLH